MSNLGWLGRAMAPLDRRLRLTVTRAVLSVVRPGKNQRLQLSVLHDEVRDNIEHAESYGYAAYPLAGATAVMLAVGGNRDHSVVTSVSDPRYRPDDLEPGEVRVYSYQGECIRLLPSREIKIQAQNTVSIESETAVVLKAPDIQLQGPVSATQTITAVNNIVSTAGMLSDQFGTLQAFRLIYNGHTHGPSPTPLPQA